MAKKPIFQSPDAVKVEDLDRAVLEIIGQEQFLLHMQNRPRRHQLAVKLADEQRLDTDAAQLARKALSQHQRWGTYERPLYGLQFRRNRALFEFTAVEQLAGKFTYTCIEPAKLWAKGDMIVLDYDGNIVDTVKL